MPPESSCIERERVPYSRVVPVRDPSKPEKFMSVARRRIVAVSRCTRPRVLRRARRVGASDVGLERRPRASRRHRSSAPTLRRRFSPVAPTLQHRRTWCTAPTSPRAHSLRVATRRRVRGPPHGGREPRRVLSDRRWLPARWPHGPVRVPAHRTPQRRRERRAWTRPRPPREPHEPGVRPAQPSAGQFVENRREFVLKAQTLRDRSELLVGIQVGLGDDDAHHGFG